MTNQQNFKEVIMHPYKRNTGFTNYLKNSKSINQEKPLVFMNEMAYYKLQYRHRSIT